MDEHHRSTSVGPQPSLEVKVHNEHFCLHYDNAAFWVEEKALLFGDVHLGKAEVFQKNGIPVPMGADEDNIRRLESLAQHFGAEKFYCLGDFIHSKLFWRSSISPRIERFLNDLGPAFTLIAGNHEAGTAQKFTQFGTRVIEDELRIRGVVLSHENVDADGDDFVISGHVHPVIKVGSYSDSFTARCFYLTEKALLLPAFGEFTGGYKVKPKAQSRVFATLENSVVEI